MLVNISANRMTLLKLKKRRTMARRGHSLMKQKLDELIHIFQQQHRAAVTLRQETDRRLHDVYRQFLFGKGTLREEALNSILAAPVINISIEEKQERLLNLLAPHFDCTIRLEAPPYGLLETNADLDESVRNLGAVIDSMLNLAALQRKIELLSREIETTRRRVNALEYILIPQIEAQVRFIKIKLDEVERADISRLMRIKSIIRGDQ